MTKNTKTLLVVGVVGVGAYLLWKSQNSKKKKMVGYAGKVGKRNLVNARTIKVRDAKFASADGNFFKVKSSKY
jgi:hypothetical protein